MVSRSKADERSSNLGTLVDFRGCGPVQPRITVPDGWRVHERSRRPEGRWPSHIPCARRGGHCWLAALQIRRFGCASSDPCFDTEKRRRDVPAGERRPALDVRKDHPSPITSRQSRLGARASCRCRPGGREVHRPRTARSAWPIRRRFPEDVYPRNAVMWWRWIVCAARPPEPLEPTHEVQIPHQGYRVKSAQSLVHYAMEEDLRSA
jgi:hypothetical protein